MIKLGLGCAYTGRVQPAAADASSGGGGNPTVRGSEGAVGEMEGVWGLVTDLLRSH